jgi:hypothetical protein
MRVNFRLRLGGYCENTESADRFGRGASKILGMCVPNSGTRGSRAIIEPLHVEAQRAKEVPFEGVAFAFPGGPTHHNST